jgi:RalA-binding protein 1
LLTIAQFLSTDVVQKHDSQASDQRSNVSTPTSVKSSTYTAASSGNAKDGDAPTREGYLTKRGKNFGGWQTRYFVLDGPQLRYYDAVCLPEKVD